MSCIWLYDNSNRAFTSVCGHYSQQFAVLQDAVAEEFRCDPDDVDTIEPDESDPDSRTIITVRGEAVGRAHKRYGWDQLAP
jgi:hypothetical protein